MDIPVALAADLASLTAALGTPGTDLEALLVGLSGSIRLAVPSCVGLSMTVVMDGFPLTLATVDEVAEVAASMRLSLSGRGLVGPGWVVVFYSANPGAFVDLAADAAFALGGDHPVLDDDPHLPVATGLGGLDALSGVNRAIGYLIGEGVDPRGGPRRAAPSRTRGRDAPARRGSARDPRRDGVGPPTTVGGADFTRAPRPRRQTMVKPGAGA